MREELKPHGTQARLARYLGLPRQRIHDFLKGGRRMPDAETTLRLVHWLSERSAGRDPSL
jgi:plasmid maintenance system antidote protein VapI